MHVALKLRTLGNFARYFYQKIKVFFSFIVIRSHSTAVTNFLVFHQSSITCQTYDELLAQTSEIKIGFLLSVT